jgi:hypothetical protein
MKQNLTLINNRAITSTSSWYEIRIGASLESETIAWIGDFLATKTECGQTILFGEIPDQPALFGALLRVRDLGLPLISVNLIPFSSEMSD